MASVKAVIVSALVVIASPVGAQPDPYTDAAKDLVDGAKAAEKARDYDKALSLYVKAFELMPHPVLLYNIGHVLRWSGRREEAIIYYRKYLDTKPDDERAAHAANWVSQLEEEIEREQTLSLAAAEQRQLDRPEQPDLPSHTPRRRIAAIGLGGAAVVSMSVALGFELSARNTYQAYRAAPDEPEKESLFDSANRKRDVAGGFLVVGLGCGVAAAYLWLTRGISPQRSTTAMVFTSPSSLGLSLSGEF